jgi:hypothetical protein
MNSPLGFASCSTASCLSERHGQGWKRRVEPDPVCGATCAVKGPLIQQVRVLPRQRSSRPGSYPSGREGNDASGAWETGGDARSSASWQAVTRVNTETAPKDTMRRPTLRGVGEGWNGASEVEEWTTRSSRFAGVVGDGMSARSNGCGQPAISCASKRNAECSSAL